MSRLSILAVRTASSLLKLVGRGGSLPGSIGLRIDPASLRRLKFKGPVILVTGTNGKTSTANLISDAFMHAGKKVVSNRKGDNLKAGITTTLLQNADASGLVQADAVVLEVDELNIRHVLPELPVSALVVTNFFRDQLDRAREMEQLIQSIEGVLPGFEGTLIVNGDDPNTVRLKNKAPKAKMKAFGLAKNKWSVQTSAEAGEGKFCPVCSHRLEYDYYQYSHIGKFHCPQCGFASPKLSVCLEDIDLENQTFKADGVSYQGPYEGMYSMYNYAALLAAAKEFGLPEKAIRDTFAHAPKPAGRNERFGSGNREVVLNLVKNPTGANEVMKVIEKDEREKTVIIVLNDHEQDGTDVSWIYDTAFERFMNDRTRRVITTGTRGNDMALRMVYGGWNGELHCVSSLEEALKSTPEKDGVIYVVATYTALLPSRNTIVREMGL